VKQYQKTLLIWLVFGLFIVTVWSLFGRTGVQRSEKPFSEVIAALNEGQIKNVTVTGNEFDGEFSNGAKFHSTGVMADSVLTSLTKANKDFKTEYVIRREEVGTFWMVLAQWLPMLLIIGLFVYFMRQSSNFSWPKYPSQRLLTYLE